MSSESESNVQRGNNSNDGRPSVFLSYGRADAKDLADRLCIDLAAQGYHVWQDTKNIRGANAWHHEIEDGLRSCQLVVALLSPHAVRRESDASRDYSVCLDEWSFAQFELRRPIVPVLAQTCSAPLFLHRLDYVDLCRWRDSEEQYQTGLARLLATLHDTRQGKVRYRSWDKALQPLDFAAFLHGKRRGFTGREWLFDEIEAWRTVSGQDRVLLIKGDPGVGKSAIIAELAHRDPRVLAYHCCQADNQQTLDPGLFVRSLAAMLASRLDDYAAQLETASVREALSDATIAGDPLGALDAGVLTPLEGLTPDGAPFYLLVDALDEALSRRDATLTIVDVLAARRERLPGWLRIIATTRKEPRVLDRLKGLRATELDAQDPRNLDDIAQYVQGRLDEPNLAERLAQSQRTSASVTQTLKEKSGGNFLYVRQALEGIERDEYHFDRLDELPPGLFGLYQSFFTRHFPIRLDEDGDETAVGYEKPKRLLQVLVAAEEPLDAAQLAAATELDLDEEFPKALRRLASYVPERAGSDGHSRYAFFHKGGRESQTQVA